MLVLVIFSILAVSAQKVAIGKDGNYYSEKSSVVFKDTITGKTFTDEQGKVFPVFKGRKGGLYVWKTSKKGVKYQAYLRTK